MSAPLATSSPENIHTIGMNAPIPMLNAGVGNRFDFPHAFWNDPSFPVPTPMYPFQCTLKKTLSRDTISSATSWIALYRKVSGDGAGGRVGRVVGKWDVRDKLGKMLWTFDVFQQIPSVNSLSTTPYGVIHSTNINPKTPISTCPFALLFIRQAIQQMDTQNHHQQSNRDNNQQTKSKPSKYHGRCANSALHASVSEILRHLRSRNRCRVLPQYAHQHEDTGDEDQSQRDLGYRPRREGLDVNIAAGSRVMLFMPAWKGREKEEGYEGEYNSDDAVGHIS